MKSVVQEAEITRAQRLLGQHREALHRVPGVLATGCGLRKGEDGIERPVVQVFVRTQADVDRVADATAEILGGHTPEIVVSGEIVAGSP